MANYLVDDTQLTSVANAIRAKSGGFTGLAFPSGFISEIGNISSEGGGATFSGNDVIFYDDLMNDCRGGIAYSYSAADFAELPAMPANPDHSNFVTHGISIPMTSQGWNWSLADAKAYVAKYGKLNIGQMYVPTDGKSHWICYVPEDAPVERWNTEIHISVDSGSVDWQVDNGTTSTASSYISVTFPSVGWHDVKISAPSGITYYPYYDTSEITGELSSKIQKIIQVFLGSNVTRISNNAFNYCLSLKSITIPSSITIIEGDAFYECYSLASITIPNTVIYIGNTTFFECYNLASITIPNSVRSIGNSAFQYCSHLISITIPNNITSINTFLFYYCTGLMSITIPDSITYIGPYAFLGCYNLTSIIISNSVTNIGESTFQECYNLKSIAIPDDVTSIDDGAFMCCYSLTSITIPDSVTSIGSNVFYNCSSLKNIIIENATPPTLSDTYAFYDLMSDYSIIVPAGSLSAYTSATNWSSLADHIVEATA